MSSDPNSSSPTVTANFKLKLGEHRLEARIDVPAGPVPQRFLLPILQQLANTVVDSAIRLEEQEGHKVSCRAGCGACCRQLVPMSETEAYHVRDLVEALPEPRRSEIRVRFDAARRRLVESGVLDRLVNFRPSGEEETRRLGVDYFKLGIPCPFLEAESCSIHPDRPVACREYLVTSPAEHCARPGVDPIRMVALPVKVWTALAALDPVDDGTTHLRWVPLILATTWADAHAEPLPRPCPELLRRLFQKLTGKPLPALPTQPEAG